MDGIFSKFNLCKIKKKFCFYYNLEVDPEKFEKNLLITTKVYLNIGRGLARIPVNI